MKPYLRRRFTQDISAPVPDVVKVPVSVEQEDGSLKVIEEERQAGGIYEPHIRYAFSFPACAEDIAEFLAGVDDHARTVLHGGAFKPDDDIIHDARIALSLKNRVTSAIQKARPGRPFPPVRDSEKGVRFDPILEAVMAAFQLGQFEERLHVRPFEMAARRGRRSQMGAQKLTEQKRVRATERAEMIRKLAAERDMNGEHFEGAKSEAVIAHVRSLWRQRRLGRKLGRAPSGATIRRALRPNLAK